MRLALFLLVFVYLGSIAQDANKVALTAGGEFPQIEQQPKSITQSQMVNCPFDVISRPKDEIVMQLPQSVEIVSSKETNPLVYVGAFLIIGIGVYFMNSQKQDQQPASNFHLESEEENLRKKELWDAMSQPETE